VEISFATYLPYDWLLQYRVNLAPVLVLQFIFGFSIMCVQNTLQTLPLELFPHNAATAAAACNIVRSWSAGVLTAVISYMLDGMGWGWTFVFLDLLLLVALSLVWVEIQDGMHWRGAEVSAGDNGQKGDNWRFERTFVSSIAFGQTEQSSREIVVNSRVLFGVHRRPCGRSCSFWNVHNLVQISF